MRDFVFPAIRGNAVYEGTYLLGTSLARPVIAKHQVEVARETGCDAVAHGATGKGNDQVRFELAYRALAPELAVIAPWREWDLKSRTDCMAYAQKYGIPVTATLKKPYSMDRNLMHVSLRGRDPRGPLARARRVHVHPDARPLEDAPDAPQRDAGRLRARHAGLARRRAAVAGEAARAPEPARRRCTASAGSTWSRTASSGMKSRGVYETPGGTVLHAAHRAIESITLDREVMHERDRLSPRFAELIYNGFWFSPEMDFLRAAHREVAGERDRRGAPQALQGQRARHRPTLSGVALLRGDGDLRGRRRGGHLPPGRRHGLHPPAGPAAAAARSAERRRAASLRPSRAEEAQQPRAR